MSDMTAMAALAAVKVRTHAEVSYEVYMVRLVPTAVIAKLVILLTNP